jgi:CBS domain-containing protein
VRWLSNLTRRSSKAALATVPVSAVILSRLPSVSPHEHLEDVAQLFAAGRVEQLPVVERGMPVGVVTRDDLLEGLERNGPRAPIGDGPRHDVVTVTPSDSLADVIAQMRDMPDALAVVVDRGQPVGVLTYERLVAYAEATKAA